MSKFRESELYRVFAPKVVTAEVVDGETKQTIHVRQLSAAQIFALQKQRTENPDDTQKFAIDLLSQALCDEGGNRLLVDPDDAAAFVEITGTAFNKIAEAALVAVGLKAAEKEGDETGKG